MLESKGLLSSNKAKNPLWLAAFFFKKLKKAQIFHIDINSSVDKILHREMDAVSYRVLAYLLLGIVKIYSKKVEYMLHDSESFLSRINKFLNNTKSKTSAETSRNSIIIPDILELDKIDIGILEDTSGYHIAPPEKITLKEVLPNTRGFAQFSQERFEDFGFDEVSCSISLNETKELEIQYNKAMEVVRSLCEMNWEMVGIDGALNFPEKSQDYETGQKENSDHDESSIVNEIAGELIEEHDIEENLEFRKKVSFEAEKSSVIPSKSTIVDETPQSRFQGSTTSEFKLIPSPASTPPASSSRKRKSVFDDTTVLSAKVLKKCIYDASDLVTVRRPLHRALLDKQRKFHISNLLNEFNESLIPLHSLKRKLSSSSKKLKKQVSLKTVEAGESESQAVDSQEHVEISPQITQKSSDSLGKEDTVEISPQITQTSSYSLGMEDTVETSPQITQKSSDSLRKEDTVEISPQITQKSSDSLGKEDTVENLDVLDSQTCDSPEHIATAPVTPPLCPNAKVLSVKHQENTKMQNSDDFEPSSPNESIGREQSLERSDGILEAEINSPTTENSKTSGWSELTRKVATCLNKNFQDQGKQGESDFVNLSQVSKGKTRKESARLFYEILVLKTTNHVDVKQNNAYGDIAVKKLPKFDQIFGVDG